MIVALRLLESPLALTARVVPVLSATLPEAIEVLVLLQVRKAIASCVPDAPVSATEVPILLGRVNFENLDGLLVPINVKLVRLELLECAVPMENDMVLLVADTMFNVLLGVLFKLTVAIPLVAMAVLPVGIKFPLATYDSLASALVPVNRQVAIVLLVATDGVIDVPDVAGSGSVKLEFPGARLLTAIACIMDVTGALPSEMAMNRLRRLLIVVDSLTDDLFLVGIDSADRADNVTPLVALEF